MRGAQQARNCAELGTLLGIYKTHNLEDIKEGIRRHRQVTGKRPVVNSGDATEYVGYKATWSTVNAWLRNRQSSLPQLCREMGIEPLRATHDLEIIKKGIFRFHKKLGETPTHSSGDATEYLGYKTTWTAVDSWLRFNKHPSLFHTSREMGFEPRRATHDLEAIEEGVRRHCRVTGKHPVRGSGDATEYVGYKATWEQVNDSLRHNRQSSLPQLCREMGLRPSPVAHAFEAIKEGVRRYHKKFGKQPFVKSGDATEYLGYKTTWMAVDSWLRHHNDVSIRRLCREMGLDPFRATHDLEAIKEGIRRYRREIGKNPTDHAGDATKYLGYRGGWCAVGQWLRKYGHGSLSRLCREMGLEALRAIHDLEAIKKGIFRFHRATENQPSVGSGDATAYLGYKTTWTAVDAWLRTNGYGSLSKVKRTLRGSTRCARGPR